MRGEVKPSATAGLCPDTRPKELVCISAGRPEQAKLWGFLALHSTVLPTPSPTNPDYSTFQWPRRCPSRRQISGRLGRGHYQCLSPVTRMHAELTHSAHPCLSH